MIQSKAVSNLGALARSITVTAVCIFAFAMAQIFSSVLVMYQTRGNAFTISPALVRIPGFSI